MSPASSRYATATATYRSSLRMAQQWEEGSLLVRPDCRDVYHEQIDWYLREARRAISIIAEVEMTI